MKEDDVKPQDEVTPENATEEKSAVQIGWLSSAGEFDIGMPATSSGDEVVFLFKQDGEPLRALGFKGEAAEKLLTSMYALLALLYSSGVGLEESHAATGLNKKTNTTLH